MILEVAGFFEPRGPRLTPSREPSGPFAGAKSPETARPTTLVDGADDWAVETTPSPEDVAAFVSPSGKFDDDASPRVAPDEALSVVLAPRCSSLPTWATARAGHQGTTNSATPGVRVSRSWWRDMRPDGRAVRACFQSAPGAGERGLWRTQARRRSRSPGGVARDRAALDRLQPRPGRLFVAAHDRVERDEGPHELHRAHERATDRREACARKPEYELMAVAMTVYMSVRKARGLPTDLRNGLSPP